MKNVGWILGILLFVGTVVSAAGTGETYKLWYRQPAKDWYEALPLGNGCMGVMVTGGVRCERLQLSEETLWSGQPAPKVLPPDIRERREQIMQHLFAGELEVAAREMNALDKMKYDGKDGIVIEGGLLRVKYGDRSVEIPTLAGESYRLGPDLRVVDRKDG